MMTTTTTTAAKTILSKIYIILFSFFLCIKASLKFVKGLVITSRDSQWFSMKLLVVVSLSHCFRNLEFHEVLILTSSCPLRGFNKNTNTNTAIYTISLEIKTTTTTTTTSRAFLILHQSLDEVVLS